MIDKIEDLGLELTDKEEDFARKIQEKLGITFGQITDEIAKSIIKDPESICEELVNIAPYGKYQDLIDDMPKMIKFLTEECVKSENWNIHSISNSESDDLIKFVFYSSAVDDGDALKGFAFVNFEGKVIHGFARSDV